MSPHLCPKLGDVAETLPGVGNKRKPELVLLQERRKERDESAYVPSEKNLNGNIFRFKIILHFFHLCPKSAI